jgi:hypothetical protein
VSLSGVGPMLQSVRTGVAPRVVLAYTLLLPGGPRHLRGLSVHARHNSGRTLMSTLEKDRAAILEIHRVWWSANVEMDIARMRTCFPVGNNYLMFNYNGHPYFGLEEKIRLWEHYRRVGLSLTGPPDVRIIKFEAIGDLAYIADEFEVSTVLAPGITERIDEIQDMLTPGIPTAERGRATEIYKRDDGEGRPIWKMWHFHCSALPAADAPRPAFNDTSRSRGGLGSNPWGSALSLIGPGRG